MTALTDRFARAVDYARIAHAAQVRKGSEIPYVYHPLAVASLVIEFGGGEDQAVAALLHDVVEDCGQAHAAIIRAQFGNAVANIVEACTDGTAEGKALHSDSDAKRKDWMLRKLTYLAHLRDASTDALLVSACDNLHNARAIVQDLEAGQDVFERFTGKRDGTLAYYHSLAILFEERHLPLAGTLRTVVRRMLQLGDCESPVALTELPEAAAVIRERAVAAVEQRRPPRKDKLQPFLDGGALVEDDSVEGIGFVPIGPPRNVR